MDACDPSYEILTLEQRKVAVQELVAQRLRYSAKLNVTEEEIFDRLLYRLSAYVLEERVAHRTQEFTIKATATARVSAQARAEIEVPKTWWQHLKQDHFPAWFTRRWPVQVQTFVQTNRKHASKTTHTVETHWADFREYAQFPAASIRTPEDFRGPVFVRREELTVPRSYEESD